MCHAAITHSLGERLLAAGPPPPAAMASQAEPTEAFALRRDRPRAVLDLTHELTPDFPTYEGTPAFEASLDLPREQAFGFLNQRLTMNEHVGTHLDAPLHASASGRSIVEIPVADLVCPLVVIDIAARAEDDADTALTPDDVSDWIAAHGELPEGACVALHSGWEKWLGTPAYRGEDANGVLHFPGFHAETAAMLAEQGGVVGLASDTLSLDIGASQTFEAHFNWLPTGRWGLESVANLGALPPEGATLILGAPKRQGGSGGPCRALALI